MDVFFTRRDEYVHVISVCGDVDLATAGDLLSRLRALAGSASTPILLDLSQTTFMDRTGLSALRDFDRYVTAAGSSVHVAAASLPVARLFELTAIEGDAAQIPVPSAVGSPPQLAIPSHEIGAWATTGT